MAPLSEVLACAALGVLLLLLGRTLRAHLRFRRLELAIPGPASLPMLGNALDLAGLTEASVLPTLLALWGGRTRSLSRISIGGQLIVFVTAPEHLEEVIRRRDLADKAHLYYDLLQSVARYGLFQVNGELWRRHRRALQPAFHPAHIERAVGDFAEEARGFVRRVVPGREVDVCENARRATSRAFLRSSVSRNLDARFDAYVASCLRFLDAFLRSVLDRSVNIFLRPDWVFCWTAAGRRLRAGLLDIERLTTAIIQQACEELGAMPQRVDADAGDGGVRERKTLLEILLQPGEHRLSEEEIRDEIKVNAGAAIETTTSALCFVFKVLSLRPDLQDRLHRELVEVFGDSDRDVHADDLPRLEYTECFIKEVLRLFPPVPFVARQVHADTELASHKLPGGTTLLLNILGAHRNPDQWPDPLEFDPDRFLEGASLGRHRCAYMPFSAGSRNCIGARYAMANLKTFLATVLRDLRVERADDAYTDVHQLPLTFDLSLHVVGGARVVFTRRTTPAAGAMR